MNVYAYLYPIMGESIRGFLGVSSPEFCEKCRCDFGYFRNIQSFEKLDQNEQFLCQRLPFSLHGENIITIRIKLFPTFICRFFN